MRTALLLLGFNRVEYFARTLASLEANPEAHRHDLHVYLDGGPKARQDELVALVEASSFRRVTFVRRDSNWGTGRHLIDARRTLFDKLAYDRIVLFEDDMTLYPNYVEQVLALADWASDYSDIGTVMAYNLNRSPEEQQRAALNHVTPTHRHFWGYCITRDVWNDIKDIIYLYEEKYIKNIVYSDRPHRWIRLFFMRKWIRKGRTIRPGKKLVPEKLVTSPFARFLRRAPTSQDAMTAMALWLQGYSRLTTVVSRATYIGETGLHSTPDVFKAMGFEHQKNFDFAQETIERHFELAPQDDDGNPIPIETPA